MTYLDEDLSRRLRQLEETNEFLLSMLDSLIQVHELVQMDTDEDRELHAKVLVTWREGLAKAKARVGV